MRWSMAERFGWTLKEVDSLSMGDLAEFYQIEDGRSKARTETPRDDSKPAGRGRR